MKNIFTISILIIFSLTGCKTSGSKTIDLSGDGQFQADPEDKGMDENWFKSNLKDTIYLPGSMAENGKGYDITLETIWTGMIRDSLWYKTPILPFIDLQNIRVPFGFNLRKYTGVAWHQRKRFHLTGQTR